MTIESHYSPMVSYKLTEAGTGCVLCLFWFCVSVERASMRELKRGVCTEPARPPTQAGAWSNRGAPVRRHRVDCRGGGGLTGRTMKDYAKGFYKSKAWKETRAAYARSVGGLCEVCLGKGLYRAGVIVHHREHINPENITDPRVLLAWHNLQLVCRDCHAALHKPERRYRVDDLGRVSAEGV